MGQENRRRFYLLTYPRTASNLLLRILNLENQPNVAYKKDGGYFFLPSLAASYRLGTRSKKVDDWTPSEREAMKQSYQQCFDALESHAHTTDIAGKICFVKEHILFMADPVAKTQIVYGQDSTTEPTWTVQVPPTYAQRPTHSAKNVTVLPDEFLATWMPTFLIRHPALAFPSQYRTMLDNEGADVAEREEAMLGLEMTLHWTRSLYEWYLQHSASSRPTNSPKDLKFPLILDADDVIKEPEVLRRYCDIVGMDPERLSFSWAPATDKELAQNGPSVNRMLSTLSASAGIVNDKTSHDLDIDLEVIKWRVEFGERAGIVMDRWVRAAMPDYEFLRARRFRS